MGHRGLLLSLTNLLTALPSRHCAEGNKYILYAKIVNDSLGIVYRGNNSRKQNTAHSFKLLLTTKNTSCFQYFSLL